MNQIKPLGKELSDRPEIGIAPGEGHLNIIFEMSLDMICIADIATMTFLMVNPAFSQVLGYSSEELTKRPYLDFIHPEDVGPTRRVAEDYLRKGEKVIRFRNRYRCKSGGYRWLSWVSHPQTQRGICVAVARDITDQIDAEVKNAELSENLKKTSSLLNAVLDAIPDPIGVQELDHRVVRYNRAGYDFLGMRPDDVPGKRCFELIGNPSPCTECATSEVYRTKQVARVEKYVPEVSRWLDVRAYPILNESGELSQVIEHLRDITREKEAEVELRAAHERLLTILDSIEAHIYVADIDSYQILFINRKMKEDFKCDPVGATCYEALCVEKIPCDHCTNSRLLDHNGAPTGPITWEGRSTVLGRWYLNVDRAIRWVDGRMVRLQVATDITRVKELEQERARMETQLQQSQKFEAIGTLAGGVAHDFNNLLMGIQGRASLMMTELTASHPHREHLRAIEDYIRSAAGLTKQLLGFARGGKYEVKPIDLNELVASSAAMFGRTKKEIRVLSKFQASPLVVEADRGQIEQVLLNLYVNAWQAMPDGGELYLETRTVTPDAAFCRAHQAALGAYAELTVTDTGIGMDATTRQRVFDPFFTTKEKSRGTGLGLASAYGIIKNHGGMIAVESEKGHGAAFTIYLPASEQPLCREAPPAGKLVTGAGTVLLVDDEEMILDVGRSMLAKLGYNVVAVKGGRQAVEHLSRLDGQVDLVILDLIMPDMDGGKTFDRIRKIKPDLPVILCSGYAMDGDAGEIMKRGCNGFIQKPFSLSELSNKLQAILQLFARA